VTYPLPFKSMTDFMFKVNETDGTGLPDPPGEPQRTGRLSLGISGGPAFIP